MMNFLRDPFFWAFISMFATVGGPQIVSGKKLGIHRLFGIVVVVLFALGRVILILPALPQPRFEIGGLHWVLGEVIFGLGVPFSTPALLIKPFTGPNNEVKLKTTSLYQIIRNPIYLGELMWCLGWSILFQSVIGVILVPFWWASFLFTTLAEEQSLERELGQDYLAYKEKVQCRIIPGLPF